MLTPTESLQITRNLRNYGLTGESTPYPADRMRTMVRLLDAEGFTVKEEDVPFFFFSAHGSRRLPLTRKSSGEPTGSEVVIAWAPDPLAFEGEVGVCLTVSVQEIV